ncbi:MAG: fructokinase [Acidiferrobacteraceae bacterium]|nr:fructokinase [Acidiferrobacteraceae bacterium]
MQIGIDVGGTKIEGVLLDSTGTEILRKRIPTPKSRGYSAIISEIATLAKDLENSSGTKCTVGIGTPGTMLMSEGILKNSNTTCLINQPIVADLEQRLGKPIMIENDANCFTISESVDGAGRGFETVFGVIMGTGVGGGLVHQNRLLPGRLHIAGEWGHNILETDGPPCYCGNNGCVETFLSGPGFENDYVARGGIPGTSASVIVNLAAHGDQTAEEAVQALLKRFGSALATVINIFDPHVIVLGGGLSKIERLYTEGRTEVAKHVFWHDFDTPILRNKHGDSAGVRGAAQLWSPN